MHNSLLCKSTSRVPTGQESQEKEKFVKSQEKSGNLCLGEKSGKNQKILKNCQKISMNRHKVWKFEPKCYVLAIPAIVIFCHSIPTCILSIENVALISNWIIPFSIEFY